MQGVLWLKSIARDCRVPAMRMNCMSRAERNVTSSP